MIWISLPYTSLVYYRDCDVSDLLKEHKMRIVNNSTYKYVHFTIQEVLNIECEEFVSVLSKHTLGRDFDPNEYEEAVWQYINRIPYNVYDDGEVNKIRSWIDCLDYLKRYFSELNLEVYGELSVVFEYMLPDGTWMDVLIIYENRVLLLEFKSGRNCENKTLEKYIYQLDEYYSTFAGGNLNIIRNRKNNPLFEITENLVFTNPEMIGKTPNDDRVIVCDEFRKLTAQFGWPMDFDSVETLINYNEGIDTDTVAVVQNILEDIIIDGVYTEDDNVQLCQHIVDDIRKKNEGRKLSVLVVKGTPGAGKTGTALSLLQNYYGVNQEIIKYITGNRNLYEVFQNASKEVERKKTKEKKIIPFNSIFGSIHNEYNLEYYCLKNDESVKDNNVRKGFINKSILLVDESQRMWASEMLSFRMNGGKIHIARAQNRHGYADYALKNNLTESYLLMYELMRSIRQSGNGKILVLFVGSGQSIYRGEESGESAIYEALERLGEILQKYKQLGMCIDLYVPDNNYSKYIKSPQINVYVEPGLKIIGNKRDEFNPKSSIFVDQLIEYKDITISKKVVGRSFRLYRRMEDIMDDLSEINMKKIKSGVLISSFDKEYNKPTVIQGWSLSQVSNDERYNFFNKDNKYFRCRYATQFDSQGLELDRVIFVWGKGITATAIGKDWAYSSKALHANKKYFEEVNKIYRRCNMDSPYSASQIERLEKEFARNSYRVLLTRATTMTHILVEDQETFDYLHQFIPAYGD